MKLAFTTISKALDNKPFFKDDPAMLSYKALLVIAGISVGGFYTGVQILEYFNEAEPTVVQEQQVGVAVQSLPSAKLN